MCRQRHRNPCQAPCVAIAAGLRVPLLPSLFLAPPCGLSIRPRACEYHIPELTGTTDVSFAATCAFSVEQSNRYSIGGAHLQNNHSLNAPSTLMNRAGVPVVGGMAVPKYKKDDRACRTRCFDTCFPLLPRCLDALRH